MSLFHPDVQWDRVVKHLFHGALIAGLVLVGLYWLAGMILYLFVKYEENEDLHTKDQAWNDELGALIAMCVVATVALIWKVVVVMVR